MYIYSYYMQRYYIVVSHFPNGHYMFMYIVTTYMYMYVYIPVHVYGGYMLSIMYHCRTDKANPNNKVVSYHLK